MSFGYVTQRSDCLPSSAMSALAHLARAFGDGVSFFGDGIFACAAPFFICLRRDSHRRAEAHFPRSETLSLKGIISGNADAMLVAEFADSECWHDLVPGSMRAKPR